MNPNPVRWPIGDRLRFRHNPSMIATVEGYVIRGEEQYIAIDLFPGEFLSNLFMRAEYNDGYLSYPNTLCDCGHPISRHRSINDPSCMDCICVQFGEEREAMIEQTLDIWSMYRKPTNDRKGICWVGITTNGSIRNDGRAVMGRGVALQAKVKIRDIDLEIGRFIAAFGNVCMFNQNLQLFTFPVKHVWNGHANLNLIDLSMQQLESWAIQHPLDLFYLPRPGCGNGRLEWKDVKPILSDLPDNVICVTR